jgi:glutamate formiminotransferase / 5-formyltetrahydrofolate cyclo-ligase
MTTPILLAVPNVSEGRNAQTIARIGAAFDSTATPGQAGSSIRLLDVHSDADHHRSVFTLAGPPRELGDALLSGAAEAVRSIDILARAAGDPAGRGAHPHVGVIDVVPLVYLDARARGVACAEALVVGERLACELDLPVFLYGELAGDRTGRTRAELRRGGVDRLAARLGARDDTHESLRPDFGPARLHPSAGAALVAAREPLVAFNLQLQAPATLADACRIAALIREGGEHGLPGLRAIGVALEGGVVAQVSMNVERPLELPLAEVVQAVARYAPIASAELVGLAPRAAFERFPAELALLGFDPERHLIENALSL